MNRNALCERLDIDTPVFAFTHCRDVAAAVSNAGGFGVLGAAYHTPDALERDLTWLDDAVGDGGYGVDIVLPAGDTTDASQDPAAVADDLWQRIPSQHRAFAEGLLRAHGVPEWPDEDPPPLLGWTAATTLPLLEVALGHSGCRLIANALGAPPKHLVERIQDTGRLVAGLCGRVSHVAKHLAAGVDLLVAVGSEGGGHVGEVSSIVLWPQVVDAAAPVPVLAAGGIGNGRQVAAAMATGAQGVWTGSLWLTVAESALQPAQKDRYLAATSEDTVRTRSWSGKPSRVLRNAWSEAWSRADAPETLGLPLQGLVTADAMRRTERYSAVARSQDVACNPAGQVIGQLNEVESCRQVLGRLLTEYADAVNGLRIDH